MALNDLSWVTVLFSGIIAALAYGTLRLIQVRRFYKDLVRGQYPLRVATRTALTLHQPKPPHSFLLGHLKLMGETYRSLPSDVHYQAAVVTIARKYNMPGVFYLDLWPVSWGQIVVTDPDVARNLTTIRDHPKHEGEGQMIDPLIGNGNIVTSNGSQWKHLHKMLSPAFAISHITNMRPMVADEVMKFRCILDEKARSGEVFKLEDPTQHLTFDVISTATFGRSLDAQAKGSPALQHFENMCRAYMVTRESLNYVRNFIVNRTVFAERSKLDAMVEALIKERFEIVKRK
jgi:cytochrome P450